MSDLILAMIHSKETPEGFYEQEVRIQKLELMLAVDRANMVASIIRKHLEVCVSTTGIPLHVGMWNVEFNPEIAAMFGLPEGYTI